PRRRPSTTSTRCRTSRAHGRCATCAGSSRRPPMRESGLRPGPWLQLTGLAGAAATVVAVVSGAIHLGTAHEVLSALALPPLLALVVAGWIAYRSVLPFAVAAFVLFGCAALIVSPWLHVALAGLALASSLVVVAAGVRGEHVAAGSWRDYVTLTK